MLQKLFFYRNVAATRRYTLLLLKPYTTTPSSTTHGQPDEPAPAPGMVDPFTSKLQHKIEKDLAKLGRLDQHQEAIAHVTNEQEESTAHNGEQGGPKGPEPTRYGDWERSGRCYDF